MLPLIGRAARRAAAALAAAEAGASSIEGARVLGPQWSIARVAPRVGSVASVTGLAWLAGIRFSVH